MKKEILIGIFALSICVEGASIDYLSNNSASFFQNPAQTANISVEGVFYNPAGTVHLEEGNYVNGNLQFTSINETMEFNSKKYGANTNAIAPSINYLHNNGNISYFGNISVIGGGAALEYKDGVPGMELAVEGFRNIPKIGQLLNPKITENKFKGENRYLQIMGGSAYKVNEKLSVSGGIKLVNAERKLNGISKFEYNTKIGEKVGIIGNKLSINSTRKANGIGGIIGLNYKVDDTLNFALKYETPVKLKFKAKGDEKGIGIASLTSFYPNYRNGNVSNRDLPGVLSLGASKKIDKLTLSTGYIHYFNKSANIDGIDYKDGYELNLGSDYKINDKFTWHLGFNYANTGAGRETFNDTEYAINSKIYTTGLTYKHNENHEFKFGLGHIVFDEKQGLKEEKTLKPGVNLSINKDKVTYDKKINVFTLGYTYKF